jgi:hypothetical protein
MTAVAKISRWLVALALVTPAAVTGVIVIANRTQHDPTADTPPATASSASSPAAATDYHIDAPLLPVRTAVLTQVISSPSELPTPADCEALLSWTAERGPAAINIGRVDLALTANRLLQVTVDDVSVAVAEGRPPTARTFIQCGLSDWRDRWEPLPGDDRFAENLTVHGEDYFTQTPVVTLDHGADEQVYKVDYDTPPERLGRKVMTVAAGERVRLPFYVARSRANVSDAGIVVLTVAVRLTINGRPAKHEFTVTMHVFHEQPPNTARYEWLTDERRWVKDRRFDPDKAAPSPAGGSYVCEIFTNAGRAARYRRQRRLTDGWRMRLDWPQRRPHRPLLGAASRREGRPRRLQPTGQELHRRRGRYQHPTHGHW